MVLRDSADGPRIYPASPELFGRLREIELEGDLVFLEIGIGPFSSDEGENRLDRATIVFAADAPPVGFVSLEEVDGAAHVVQLSVVPSVRRRGVGAALLRRAIDWAREEGYGAMTLTTFRDVPWNGPFYEQFGFQTCRDLTSGLARLRAHETAIGDDDFGPRVAMRLDL